MGRLLKIIGGLVSVITFIIYYQYAYNFYPNVPQWSIDVLRNGYFLGMSIVFFGIGIDEKRLLLRHLVYYPIAFFFLFVLAAYVLNDYFDSYIFMHKTLLSILLTLSVCPISALISYLRKR